MAKINIYDRKTVVKTYTCDDYEIEMGVLEDLMGAIKLDELQSLSTDEIFGAVRNLMATGRNAAYEVLHLIFDDITDEEIRHTHISEITALLVECITYGMQQMMSGVTMVKNRQGLARR